VSFDKGDFTGRQSLVSQKEKGISRKLVGFKMIDKPVAREHYPVFKDGVKIGEVTSGSYAPTYKGSIGMAYVSKGYEAPGAEIEIEIYGRKMKAEVVARPFVPLHHKKALAKNKN